MNIFGNPTDANGGFQSPAETTLDMNNYKIINLDNPINNKDGANKLYVDSAISTGLPPGSSYSDYIYWDNTTSSYKSDGDKVHIGSESGAVNQSQYATAIGYNSGHDSQSGNAVAIGNGAGNQNQGPGALALGALSGLQNQGVYATAIGYQSGFQNQSNNATAIGINSGYQSQGLNAIAVGCQSGNQSQGDYAIALGFQSGEVSQPSYSVCIGPNTNCTLPHEVALGDSSCPQVKSHGYFVSDQGFKLSSGGSSTQYFTTDGGVGTPSSSGSSNIYLYNSSTNTDLLNINSGQIRYNNSVQPIANQICISHLTRDNVDIDAFLELIAINNIIYIQDQNTSLNYIKYKVVLVQSVPNNYYLLDVQHLDSAGTGATNFPNGHDIFMSIYTDTATIDSRLNTLDTEVLNLQNNKLSLSGGFMTGNIEMQNNGMDHISYLSFNGTTNCGFANINNYDMAQNVLVGQGNTNNGEDQILLGTGNTSTGTSFTLGVGYVNNVDSNFGIALGFNNTHGDTQQNQICIGSNNTTSGEGAMAFGSNITNGTKNSLCIGTSNMQWIFPNSGSCALGNPSIHPFKELYIDGGIIRTSGTANELYCGDGTIDTVTINNAASALTIANEKVAKAGDTMTGNLILQHDIYQASRMIQGCIYTTSNQSTLSVYGTLLASHITNVGTPTPLAVGQTNANTLTKIIKIICQPTSIAAYQDSGFLGNNTFYRNQAGLYVGMGFSYNITFGIGDTNISGGVYSVGMQVGFVASPTTPLWSATITPDNTPSWFGVGHNYSDSVLSFYNKGTGGAGTKTATPYGVSTPSTLYFSLTMINQFNSNDVLLVLKELISNTTITQTYTMSGTNSVSNTTRLYPVFTRMMGATASSGSAQISFSSMTLTA
jgi:hypothetical protein